MRNSATLHWPILFAVLTLLPAVASAHSMTDDQLPAVLLNPVISADGAHVRVRSTDSSVTFTIERAQTPRISRDSRWVSALQTPVEESGSGRAGQTLVLLDLQDGSQRTFERVRSYEVAAASAYLIYVQWPEADKASRTPDEPNLGTLHLIHLESDTVSATIENVARHVTHQPHDSDQTTDHLAYVSYDGEAGHDTLNIIALGRTSGWGYRGTHEGGKIEGLCWARDAITLGFLDSTETSGKDGERRVNSALYMWHVAGPNVQGNFTRVDAPQ